MREYTLLCEDGLASDIERLAHEYGLTQEAVIRQLVATGLEELERSG